MSDDSPHEETLDSQPVEATPPDAAETKKAPVRSPIERAFVWGLIAVLLILVSLEFAAHLKYTKALRAIDERHARAENTGDPFPATDLVSLTGGRHPDERAEIQHPLYGRCVHEIYQWNGPLRKRSIKLFMTLGDDSEILSYETLGKVPEEEDAPAP